LLPFQADQHRVQAADEDERSDAEQVLDADDLVVGAQAEVAPDALLLLLPQGGRLAEQPLHRIVREAETDEEPDHTEQVADEERDVVLVRVVEVGDAGAGDLVP
jgi:hypothetical protein